MRHFCVSEVFDTCHAFQAQASGRQPTGSQRKTGRNLHPFRLLLAFYLHFIRVSFRGLLPVFVRMAGQELVQVDGFELLAGQGLLQRRQLQDGLEYRGHGTVVCKSLVVED